MIWKEKKKWSSKKFGNNDDKNKISTKGQKGSNSHQILMTTEEIYIIHLYTLSVSYLRPMKVHKKRL